MSDHNFPSVRRTVVRFSKANHVTGLVVCLATGGCLDKLNRLDASESHSPPQTVIAPATPSGLESSETPSSDHDTTTSNGLDDTFVSPISSSETNETNIAAATETAAAPSTSNAPSSTGSPGVDDTLTMPSPVDEPDAAGVSAPTPSETHTDSRPPSDVTSSTPDTDSTLADSTSADSTSADSTSAAIDTSVPDGPPEFFDSAHGLLLWLDADDDASFTGGSAVTAWSDRSGNAAHVAQASTSAQPTRIFAGMGGLPVVRFDGLDDGLKAQTALTNRAFEGFVVWQSSRVPPNTKSTVLANSRNFEVNHGHISDSARAAVSVCIGDKCESLNSGWYDANFDRGKLSNTAYLWHFAFDGATNQLLADAWGGTRITQSGPTDLPVPAATPFSVGNCNEGNCSFQGDIAEVLLFDSPLSDSEQARAIAYLTTKWSLTTPAQ